MKKIVILGCENSHANSFLNFIRDNTKYSDVEVLGVYSDDAPAAQKLADEYGVKIMSAYDEAVGQVDGVIVTARHGDNHINTQSRISQAACLCLLTNPSRLARRRLFK
jgi:predicted dehydrogenase